MKKIKVIINLIILFISITYIDVLAITKELSNNMAIVEEYHLKDIAVFALIGTIIIIGVLILSNKLVRRATSAKIFLNKDTMKITDISEMYLGAQTSKSRLTKNK